MAHLRIQSVPDMSSHLQELTSGDSLVAKFLAEEVSVHPKVKCSVFERLYRDGETKRKLKSEEKEGKTTKGKAGIRPKIEDILLKKYEDSKHNFELLRAKWNQHVMKEVFDVPRINPRSAELARRPTPYGGYWRCYAHENSSYGLHCGKKVVGFEESWKIRNEKIRAQRTRKYSEIVPPEKLLGKEQPTATHRPAAQSLPVSQPTSPPVQSPRFPVFSADPLEIPSSVSSSNPLSD